MAPGERLCAFCSLYEPNGGSNTILSSGTPTNNIEVIPLSSPDADKAIDDLGGLFDKVVILEAFDEDMEARKNHDARLDELLMRCREARRLLVTCRSQFFRDDKGIPLYAGSPTYTPRAANVPGKSPIHRITLSPFDSRQVSQYLRSVCKPWYRNIASRRTARPILSQIDDLSVRPMLLAYIPDLVAVYREGRTIITKPQVYEAMIEAWIVREDGWVNPDALREFSHNLAYDLLLKSEHRGGEFIQREELSSLASKWGIKLNEWQMAASSIATPEATISSHMRP